jgi:hypothetical protein
MSLLPTINSEKKDEVKALVALGVIASLAVLLQLWASGLTFFRLPPNPKLGGDEFFVAELVMYSFGTYTVFLALALGMEQYKSLKVAGDAIFRRTANFMFMTGGIFLMLFALLFFVRIFLSL